MTWHGTHTCAMARSTGAGCYVSLQVCALTLHFTRSFSPQIDMDEISNFCTGDICQLRSDAATTPDGAPSVAQLRDDPPWVRAVGGACGMHWRGLGVLGFGHGSCSRRPSGCA